MHTPGPKRTRSDRPLDDPADKMNPVLVLIGASVRAAVESAAVAGYRVLAIDRFGDRETLASADRWLSLDRFQASDSPREILKIARRLAMNTNREGNCSLSIAMTGGFPSNWDWTGIDRKIFVGGDPELFQRCERPESLQRIADRSGIRFPQTVIPVAKESAGIDLNGDWLVKRLGLSGGLGVRCYSKHRRHPNELGPHDAYLQRREFGRVVGVTFVADGTRAMMLGACRLLHTRLDSLPFVFCGAVGPVCLDTAIDQQLVALANRFVAENEFVGPLNIDLLIDRNSQPVLLEINPRWSASMEVIERSWERRIGNACSFFDPPQKWVSRLQAPDVCDFADQRDVADGGAPVFAKRVLYAQREQLFNPADFDDRRLQPAWFWKDVPSGATLVGRNEPIATLIACLGPRPIDPRRLWKLVRYSFDPVR